MKLDTKEFEGRMKKAIEVYEENLGTIRVGRANASVLSRVTVDYYGTPTAINQVADVRVADARTLTITPWDQKLNKEIEKAILENLRNVRKGKTTILIAHRISTVEGMDKIVFVDDGQVVSVGTHDELYKACHDYRVMVDLQKLDEKQEGEEASANV